MLKILEVVIAKHSDSRESTGTEKRTLARLLDMNRYQTRKRRKVSP